METTKHSPTPWRVDTDNGIDFQLVDADNRFVSMGGYGDGGNLRHVVHCVNTLPKLVEALEAMQAACQGPVMGVIPRLSEAIKLIDAALEAAKGAE